MKWGEVIFVKEKYIPARSSALVNPRKGQDRNKKQGIVIWFTGLSSSGKTTVALKTKEELESGGKSVTIIDGDNIRKGRHKHLGFTRADVKKNNKLIAELAKDKAKKFDFVLVPIISPFKEDRAAARSNIGLNFFELFINLPLEECIRRDIKGLYKKALAGEIDDLIGVSKTNPYEPPDNPDIEIKSDKLNVEESASKVINFLKEKNLLW